MTRTGEATGLARIVSGLRLGPEGWVSGRPLVSWPALIAILSGGALLRVIGIDQDLWIDETATLVNYLRLPIGLVVRTYSSANQHLLYSVLGSASVSAFGESPWAARLPALLFGVAGLAALYSLGRVITCERETLYATALMAVSYHHVWFSQSARGYTGMIFFSLLGTALFLRALARNRGSTWAAYVACMTLGVLCLLNTAFVMLGHLATYYVVLPRDRRAHAPLSRRVLASALMVTSLSALAHALVLGQMLEFYLGVDRTGLGWSSLAELLPVVARGLRTGLGALGLAAMLALLAAGAASYWRQSPLVACLLVLPGAFNLAALALMRYGAYPRSFLYVLPLALLLAARGAMTLGRALARASGRDAAVGGRLLGPGLALVLLAASAAALASNYRFPKQDYSGALAYVRAHASPGDEVAAVGLAAVSYRLYHAPSLRIPSTAEQLRALRGPDHSLWVLWSFPRDMRLRFPELLDAIERDFRLEATFRGTLGDGDLYVSRAGPIAR
jgi:hypothetical protein